MQGKGADNGTIGKEKEYVLELEICHDVFIDPDWILFGIVKGRYRFSSTYLLCSDHCLVGICRNIWHDQPIRTVESVWVLIFIQQPSFLLFRTCIYLVKVIEFPSIPRYTGYENVCSEGPLCN